MRGGTRQPGTSTLCPQRLGLSTHTHNATEEEGKGDQDAGRATEGGTQGDGEQTMSHAVRTFTQGFWVPQEAAVEGA